MLYGTFVGPRGPAPRVQGASLATKRSGRGPCRSHVYRLIARSVGDEPALARKSELSGRSFSTSASSTNDYGSAPSDTTARTLASGTFRRSDLRHLYPLRLL